MGEEAQTQSPAITQVASSYNNWYEINASFSSGVDKEIIKITLFANNAKQALEKAEKMVEGANSYSLVTVSEMENTIK